MGTEPKHRKTNDENSVRLPKFYFYFGIFMGMFLSLPIFGEIIRNKYFYLNIGFWAYVVFDSLLFIMALSQIKWRIYPLKDGFIHINTFGKKRVLTYGQIQSIRHWKTGDIAIKIKGKRIPLILDKYIVGWENFVLAYDAWYQTR